MKWLLASLVLAAPAMAEPDLGGCADVFSDCHDNCSLKFGASQKDRIKLNTCINKCTTVEQDCRDRYLETQVHQLDEGALKNANARPNDDLREDGSKDKTAKKKDEEPPKRTSTRAADLDPKPAAKTDGTTASTTASTTPAPAPSSSEPGTQKRSADEDDKAKGDAAKKKKADADTTTSSSKKKKSALDEWDPEAL